MTIHAKQLGQRVRAIRTVLDDQDATSDGFKVHRRLRRVRFAGRAEISVACMRQVHEELAPVT